ncbi:LA2681-like HEPN domain containing protein [Fimbriimonadaceae bacterium]
MAIALEKGDIGIALDIASASIRGEFINDILSFNSAGVLIDVGSHGGEEDLIRQGMEVAEAFIADTSVTPECHVRARYNLSNGYAALAFINEQNGDIEGRLKHWGQQRDELQKLALDRRSIPSDLVTEVLTNFGNVMDELGRTVEAIDLWDQVLAIDPDHPVALGSKGQAYLRLLGIQPIHNLRVLEAARDCLEKCLSQPERITRHADYSAIGRYEKSLVDVKRIATQLAGQFDAFQDKISMLRDQHDGWQPDSAHLAWARAGLLLTVNPFPEWCPDTLKDDIFFDGLGTEANETGTRRFTELAHTLNQIKEDFALARYSLTMAAEPDAIVGMSSVTQFADTLDYADFGLASAMIKASIRTSVDIFDKIANFMNRYLQLGIPDRKVSFASVWYEKGVTDPKKRVESPILTKLLPTSGWLRGIRDVAENLNFYPAPSKDARNKVTHDYLIIENAVRPSVVLHGKVVSVDAHEYARQLLMMAKGAVVNLVALVQREESLRLAESENSRQSIPFLTGTGISDQLAACDPDSK